MDLPQIDPSILTSICTSAPSIVLTPDTFKPAMAKQITDWNAALQPSFNVVKAVISNFLTGDLINKAAQEVLRKVKMLQEAKCPKNFLRAYLVLIKPHVSKIHQLERQNWREVQTEMLETYFNTFSLVPRGNGPPPEDSYLIPDQQLTEHIYSLADRKQYPQALVVIKLSHCQPNHVNYLISKMANNKQASKAADYITAMKLNPKDYPAVGQRLSKTTTRHFLTKNGWAHAEDIFQDNPEALAFIVQDLIYRKSWNESLSLLQRHPEAKEFITKKQSLQYLATNPIPEIIANPLHASYFGPSDPKKYFSLAQFGIQEEDVIWVDNHAKNLIQILQEIYSSPILGIDTEAIVGQTKFQRNPTEKQQAATIQIATLKRIFIFDGFNSDRKQIRECLMTVLRRDSTNIIGHALGNDLSAMLRSVGCTEKQIEECVTTSVIDVWKLFKVLHPQKKYSNLAYICETVLGKEICKQQTLTNWRNRPLRRNQLHYAAMDAYVVLKVYQKYVEQNGEQMVHYYAELQES